MVQRCQQETINNPRTSTFRWGQGLMGVGSRGKGLAELTGRGMRMENFTKPLLAAGYSFIPLIPQASLSITHHQFSASLEVAHEASTIVFPAIDY